MYVSLENLALLTIALNFLAICLDPIVQYLQTYRPILSESTLRWYHLFYYFTFF